MSVLSSPIFIKKRSRKQEPTVAVFENINVSKKVVQKIWQLTKINSDGCRDWQGYRTSKSFGRTVGRRETYGRISINSKRVLVHRLVYFLYYCEEPGKLSVCHTCDNPACVNPFHLFLGTNHDNVQDKIAKGRLPVGETNGKSKVTAQQVREIKELYRAGELTYKEIAARFPITASGVNEIVNGRNWKHVN